MKTTILFPPLLRKDTVRTTSQLDERRYTSPWQRRLRVAGLLALACAIPSGGLRASSAAETAASSTRKSTQDEAFIALQKGDSGAALAKLGTHIDRGPNAPHETLQTAMQLAVLGGRAKTVHDIGTMKRAATLALAHLESSVASMSARDASASNALKGRIYDHLLDDRTRAIEHYEAALRQDSSLPAVPARLAYLKAVDESSRRKAAENEVLRQRASQRAVK